MAATVSIEHSDQGLRHRATDEDRTGKDHEVHVRAATGLITTEIAMAALAVVRGEAERLGVFVSVAVVDSGGHTKAFVRMDGAEIAGTTLAPDKAYTAAICNQATQELAADTQPGGSLYGLHGTSGGRMMVIGGGVPVVYGDEVVGALGVSGASVTNDITCASAGVRAIVAAIGTAQAAK